MSKKKEEPEEFRPGIDNRRNLDEEVSLTERVRRLEERVRELEK